MRCRACDAVLNGTPDELDGDYCPHCSEEILYIIQEDKGDEEGENE